jgi:uncharacterized protein (TIGR00725 family)
MKQDTWKQVAIIGANDSGCTQEQRAFARALGASLVKAGYVIISGGCGGVMEAVCRGAHDVVERSGPRTICILPDDGTLANAYCDVIIPTGMGIARNKLVVHSAHAVVAIGGGAGTLSELAMAWQLGKRILCVTGLGGWSGRLAGECIDQRSAVPLASAATVEEVMTWLAHG